MSNVRVNLLPDEVGRQHRAARGRLTIAAAGVGLLLVLALAYFWQMSRVDGARQELAAEQEALQARQAEQAELGEYAELQARRTSAMELLQSTLGGEVSVAGVLQDLATVLPPDVQLEAVSITVDEAQLSIGDQRPALGTLALEGFALDGHAPGLERVLLELDKLAAFSDVFLSNSTLEVTEPEGPDEVVSFSIQVDLGPEVLTGRYAEGIPEALR